MHSQHRGRGKIFFEALCALGLAASFAGAWDETGSTALLASASIMALFAIYWSFGLVSRDRPDHAAQRAAAVAEAREVEVAAAEEISAPEPEVPTAERVEVYPFQPDVPTEPQPVEPAPKKKRARKTKKATAEAAPAVERPEPVAFGEPIPIEPLFETQPFVRQPRPAFGRKARGPRTLPAA